MAERANYLGVPAFFNLNQACAVVVNAFGPCVYLVGSCLERRDFRDVDVRVILGDPDFARRYPAITDPRMAHADAYWSLTCVALSEWLGARTGLPIDFQIQQQTHANLRYAGARHALGLFYGPQREGS